MMSSICSNPTEIRIRLFVTPTSKRASSETLACVVDAGWVAIVLVSPKLALKDFSATIADYENTLQETFENDYDWARYIFNPESLKFEKSETSTYDKSFSLIKNK